VLTLWNQDVMRYCYATRLCRDRISNRRSRSSSVADTSSYLPDEKYTLYRRAHICHQVTSSGTVDLGPLFSNEEVGLRDHRRVRWREPSIGGIVSPKDKEPKSVTDESHSTTVTAQSYLNSLIIEFTPHT
jgi:hypothetical protein